MQCPEGLGSEAQELGAVVAHIAPLVVAADSDQSVVERHWVFRTL